MCWCSFCVEAAVAGHRDLNRAGAPGAAATDGHGLTQPNGCTGSARAHARACDNIAAGGAGASGSNVSMAMGGLFLQATMWEGRWDRQQ